jgi:glycosyltransferase involved in cell wall biosynthesis
MMDDGEIPGRVELLSMAFVSPGWPPNAFANGIVPYVANITDEMRIAGHRVTIVAQKIMGEESSDKVRNVETTRIARSMAVRAVDSLVYRVSNDMGIRHQVTRALVTVCRGLIEDEGLQIVEMEESFGVVRRLQRGLPIPVVVRLHGPWFLNGPLRGAIDDAAFRRRVRLEKEAILEADAITTPSLDVLERTREYYGLPLEHARVIPPPTTMIAPEARWKPETSEAETIVFVGRFDRHKGGDLVIDAFAELARRRPEARLLFAGPDANYRDDDGRLWKIEDYIRDRIPDDGIASRVRWLGAQPSASLPDLRRRGAVVVVGSRYDNFPVTVLEAMALGSPLVAPRVGGIPEIVVDGVNGLLYEAGSAGDMAAKLGRVLEDRDLAVKLGAQAALDCERRHNPATLAREIAGFFREVIEARGRSRREIPPR